MENHHATQNTPPQKESSGCLATFIMFIIFSLIAIAVFFFIGYLDNKPNSSNSGSGDDGIESILPIRKERPSVTMEQTLTKLLFNIQCNDDYDYVILSITIYDKNYNVIRTFTLREDNMKKGELRQAEYKLSLSDQFNADSVRTSIQDYK